MSVIIVEGPEKAGKSTLVKELSNLLQASGLHKKVRVRHNVGRAVPDDSEYSRELKQATSLPARELVEVWDRGWPSEFVYGLLLGQDRRLAMDPWLGEWLHGRAVQANGVRVMLPGPEAHVLRLRRTLDDAPVDPEAEQNLYKFYAKTFGWLTLPAYELRDGSLQLSDVTSLSHMVLRSFGFVTQFLSDTSLPLPPIIGGSLTAKTLVLGEKRSSMHSISGGWLPFSSWFTTKMGRVFGNSAFDTMWGNADDFPPYLLESFTTIVACGRTTHQWVMDNLHHTENTTVYGVAHPAHAFRFVNVQTDDEKNSIFETIRQLKTKGEKHGK